MSSIIPKHVAIIMDGNGRWAERQGKPRIFGHIRGCGRVREIIRAADAAGVQALTLYAFSTENWGRPFEEISLLMRLLGKWLVREQREIMQKSIRFRAIGNLLQLPAEIYKMVEKTQEMSRENTGLQLTLALSYGSREEIIQAAQKLARKVMAGEIIPENINEQLFSESLSTTEIGDPDLLIRTSGELRVSNFLLWQMAYTELYFIETMWPDFKTTDFRRALESYARRQRRFGLTSAQQVVQELRS